MRAVVLCVRLVDLYKRGLIYRDKRLVNWDPKLHTAIADLEVEQREMVGVGTSSIPSRIVTA